MSAGLLSLAVVGEFLGKPPGELDRMIKEDGLPVIVLPTRTRPGRKVSLIALHRWLRARSVNFELTMEQLDLEVDRAALALSERVAEKAERKRKRDAMQAGEAQAA